MKFNRKIQRFILSKKDYKTIIFKNDYLCINGCFLIHYALIDFDDFALTQKLQKEEFFNYGFQNNKSLNIPEDIYWNRYTQQKAGNPCRIFDFTMQEDRNTTLGVIVNVETKTPIFINAKYLEIMKQLQKCTGGEITENDYVITLHNQNNELLCLAMAHKGKEFRNQLYTFVRDIEIVKGESEERQ